MKLYFCAPTMQIRNYISLALLLIAVVGYSQTSNPFDLKWRSGKPIVDNVETPKSDTLVHTGLLLMPEVDSTHNEKDTIDADLGVVLDHSDEDLDAEADEIITVDPVMVDTATIPAEVPGAGDSEKLLSDQNRDNSKIPIVSIAEIQIAPAKPASLPVKKIGLGLFLTFYGLALIILTWAVNINRGFLRRIYRAALNENFSALLLREQRFASSQYLYYVVYTVFFLNSGLFLYLISRYGTWGFGHSETPILIFLAFLVVVYVMKHLIIRVIGDTFQISKEMRHYNFNIILYNILAGIALMPVILFLAFGPESLRMPMIYTGLSILGLMYLMRQIRGIVIGSHLIAKDVFQFFVYLCAIEILPVLVLFKYFPN